MPGSFRTRTELRPKCALLLMMELSALVANSHSLLWKLCLRRTKQAVVFIRSLAVEDSRSNPPSYASDDR